MQKIQYEIDPFNRLIAYGESAESGFCRFRKVLDGQFKLDGNNSLSYHIKSPVGKDISIPNQIRINGRWSLTENHDLQLTVDKEERRTFGNKITFSGRILDVNENAILFSVATRSAGGSRSAYVLDLQGTWRADKNNRLTFSVKREEGKSDLLILTASWTINDAHQIVYSYEKTSLIRKDKEAHELIFKGHWDLRDNICVSYIFDGLLGAGFDFRSSICMLEKNYIKFEIGAGLKTAKEVFILFGRWKLKKDAGLLFEIEYGDRKRYTMTFGADVRLAGKDTLEFKIKNSPAGTALALKLKRDILGGDGELLLSALGSSRELAIYAGAAWRW